MRNLGFMFLHPEWSNMGVRSVFRILLFPSASDVISSSIHPPQQSYCVGRATEERKAPFSITHGRGLCILEVERDLEYAQLGLTCSRILARQDSRIAITLCIPDTWVRLLEIG